MKYKSQRKVETFIIKIDIERYFLISLYDCCIYTSSVHNAERVKTTGWCQKLAKDNKDVIWRQSDFEN